jgi:L-asparaginase II
MADLLVVDSRGSLKESVHRVAIAVIDSSDRLVASAGLHDEPVFWRSTAKPFQLWPLVVRGGVTRWHLTERHLALGCASHNAERIHREVASEWLEQIGAGESDLACGGHPSLSTKVAESMIREGVTPTALWSNCSGKHAAMLALARLEGWPTSGYQQRDHPVQQAVAESIARWSDLPVDALQWGVDGCTAAAVATPLRSMALAWARLGNSDDPAMSTIRGAMLAHPELVAGSGRLDTILMTAWPGRVLVKVGAEGVFAAALPGLGLGLALKVADGDLRAAAIALVAALEQVVQHLAPTQPWPVEALAPWRSPSIRNTRGQVTGESMIHGKLEFA